MLKSSVVQLCRIGASYGYYQFMLVGGSNIQSEVWQLCLKLREIAELICAPRIHQNEVAYMKVLLEEYMYLRNRMFPDHPLKPKHHYLLNYPDLILKFGPLIRL